jgi:phage N-6-adenine-methyltransferase
MAISKSLYTKGGSDEYETPKALFDYLNSIFEFELDPCAKPSIEAQKRINTKEKYTQDEDGLDNTWVNFSTFVNPPYSKISKWIDKAIKEYDDRLMIYARFSTPTSRPKPIVMLVPARTDTKWFHKIANYSFTKVILLKGRLRFNNSKNSSPFPSCLIILSSVSYLNKFETTIQLPTWIMDVKNLD